MAVIGHDSVQQRLTDGLVRGDLHHALLFEGPAGVGKRLVAERLAAAANCLSDGARPCGVCPSCRQIAAGNHPDVIRIEPDADRASGTIAVEQIREMIRMSGYHRYAGRRRFVIIDPAEALMPAAANALLKTLEEPPAGTGFVLIATHASALLSTIVSRCQRVRFGPVPEPLIAAFLRERGLADPDGAARLSLGCPGRALQLAEHGLDERRVIRTDLLTAVAGDLGGIFAFGQKLADGSGRQEWRPRMEMMLDVVEDLLRDVTVLGSGADLPLLNADTRDVVERWTPVLWPGGVAVLARSIAEARENLAANVSGRTIIDALVARLRAELGPARKAA